MYMTKKEIMAKFGITHWPTMTYHQYIEVGKSLEIDLETKFWIMEQSPYYANPFNEETSVIADTIKIQIDLGKIENALKARRALINKIRHKAF